jgi:hypothetical protein
LTHIKDLGLWHSGKLIFHGQKEENKERGLISVAMDLLLSDVLCNLVKTLPESWVHYWSILKNC